MRILSIADVLPAPNSGAAGTDYETVRALARAGHHVEAVWADELGHRITHYNLRYLVELPLSLRQAMLSRLRRGKFDVVQIGQPHGYLAAKALAQSAARPVFVHRSHGFEPCARAELEKWRVRYPEARSWYRSAASRLIQRMLERSNRLITKYATGHVVSATRDRDYMAAVYDVGTDRIRVIPQAIPEHFGAGARPLDATRARKLLYVGQYAFVKAPVILGAVVSRILTEFPDAEFTWVCAARHHDAAAAHLSPEVRHRVKFLDWMEQEDLARIYDRHGVFLFPSFYEGFGKVFLEAMSRGLVVIASRTGGAEDVISDGVDGFVVETGNVAEMSRVTGLVLNDLGLATKVSRHAIEKARIFSWDRYADECTEFYGGLIRAKENSGHWRGDGAEKRGSA